MVKCIHQEFDKKTGVVVYCNNPAQLNRMHGWTCEEHDVVERPYAQRRMRIERQLELERRRAGDDSQPEEV